LPHAVSGYRSWDIAKDRAALLAGSLPDTPLWIFDEIHKYRSWRNWLKGLWDGRRQGQRILVAGSARLDFYRYSGDSLQGRYHLLRLHPYSCAELRLDRRADLEQLCRLGGFPEPFLSGSEVAARRWSRDYRTRLVREEVRDLEQIQDLGNLELMLQRLPDLVGSPLSVNAIREDLQINHKTAAHWLTVSSGSTRSSGCRRSAPRRSAPSRRRKCTTTGTGPRCPMPARASRTWLAATC
jgi:hypothetical protein